MAVPKLLIVLLSVAGFSLATRLEPWFQTWQGNRGNKSNIIGVALGDGQRLFARHIYVKADAYFHNGAYPSIYDQAGEQNESHMTESAEGHTEHEGKEGEHDEGNFLGEPHDWLDRFERHFFPSRHTHVGDDLDHDDTHQDCEQCRKGLHTHPHTDEAAHTEGAEREILPWLRLSAELDPERIETYTVGAYWLRRALKKSAEAEQFLREGLRANPGNPELLFELGKVYRSDRQDPVRARNLWEMALARWSIREAGKPEPSLLLRAELLGNLIRVEEESGNFGRAVEYLTMLQSFSPNKESVQGRIDEMRKKQATPAR